MPLFVLNLTDKPNSLELRKATRVAHRAWLEVQPEMKLAGPVLSEGAAFGSMLVIEVADLAAAAAWAANDPYAKAGLFETVDIRQWDHVLGSLGQPG